LNQAIRSESAKRRAIEKSNICQLIQLMTISAGLLNQAIRSESGEAPGYRKIEYLSTYSVDDHKRRAIESGNPFGIRRRIFPGQ